MACEMRMARPSAGGIDIGPHAPDAVLVLDDVPDAETDGLLEGEEHGAPLALPQLRGAVAHPLEPGERLLESQPCR